MKRFLTILLTTLALTGVLCVSASASNFDNAAEELSKIGMLKGSADGFNLDQVPTRGQAAIMLVRLFGAETQAQNTYRSGRITCPFTDVSETVAPYVAWLVDEGLANGTSETTFGASDPCTAKAYTIFLLRALGYKDGTDFTTVTAQDFAAGLGILDTSAITGTFLRDDLAALTYQALGTSLKDGSTYLLDSLIEEGVIDSNAAYPMVEKIENCRALNDASASMNTALDASIDMNMALTTSTTAAGNSQPTGQIQYVTISGKGSMKMIFNQNPQMAVDLAMDVDGESQSVKMWLRNGWLYMQDGETSIKMEMDEDMQELLVASAGKTSGASILPFAENLTKKTSGTDTVYTLELNSAFDNMLNSIVAQTLKESGIPESAGGKITVEGFTLTYTVKGGTLKSATADLVLSVDMNLTEGVTTTIGMVMEMEMGITATGSAVKISYPDFSKFVDAPQSQAA